MKKLTPFGNYLRKYRINQNIKLKEMAEQLGISSARLSAIEYGTLSIPKQFSEKIAKIFNLSDRQSYDLKRAQLQSQNEYCIEPSSLKKSEKKVLIEFLLENQYFDEEGWLRLQRIINRSQRMRSRLDNGMD